MILGLDHVGIAVTGATSVAGAAGTFSRLLGRAAGGVETLADHGVQVCFIPVAPPNVELLAPLAQAGESPVARFLGRRGEGLHHVCFAVDDIHAELDRLRAAGFALIDATPRRGHGGLVAFVHPRSTHGVLVELLQRDLPPSHRAGATPPATGGPNATPPGADQTSPSGPR